MKLSALYDKYDGFRNPTFTLCVNNQSLNVGSGVKLESMECRLTTLREAGTLTLSAELEVGTDGAKTWLKAIQLGAVCTLSLGYAGTEQKVFSGFVYDAYWDDPLGDTRMMLEMTCLDVRGQLMLASCPDAGAARTLSQLVTKLLGQPCCTRMASAQIKAIPKEWDLPFQRTGPTDFKVLCSVADFLCFEFYAHADIVYFGPARESSETVVTFDGPNGLMRLRRHRSLAGQCAGVAVSGADDKGERIYAREARKADSGFGVGQIKSALALDLSKAEPAVQTMAQAQYLAKARMKEHQRRSSMLLGQGTGIPDLRPGRYVQATGLSEQVNGSFYIQTVIHTIDETGFETRFEAEE